MAFFLFLSMNMCTFHSGKECCVWFWVLSQTTLGKIALYSVPNTNNSEFQNTYDSKSFRWRTVNLYYVIHSSAKPLIEIFSSQACCHQNWVSSVPESPALHRRWSWNFSLGLPDYALKNQTHLYTLISYLCLLKFLVLCIV